MKLTDAQCIELVTGKGMWHTADCNGMLPAIHLSDGPYGLRSQDENALSNNDSKRATCFPTESAIASSWDTDAVSRLAEAIAHEALLDDVSVILGPGTNIKRSPLCGRNFEYFSEDPFLSGCMAAAYIRAVQKQGIGTSLKHFAGNSQETARQTANSEIDERALREIYLSAFETAVRKGAPGTVMASYNRLNGTCSCENSRLLTDILRKEWGFKGAVVSDWGACTDLAASIKAGMDLEMPDSHGVHIAQLRKDIDSGRISMDDVRQAAERVMNLVLCFNTASEKRKLALSELNTKDKEDLLNENHVIARSLSSESAVLLKNDGILPLTDRGIKIAAVGDLAENMRFQGGGSSHINTSNVITAVEALRDKGFRVDYEKGYDSASGSVNEELVRAAVSAASDADIVIMFGGLTEKTEGEGYDRRTLSLPDDQIRLAERLYAANRNIVFVSFGGAPFTIPFAEDLRAMLHMYLGGEAVGEAAADLISGDANPSGKLAETFPLSETDIPCTACFATGSDDVEYRESIFTGYRYYDTFNVPVQYPFGYGLSYTSFEYSDLHLSSSEYSGGELAVSFLVKNTGGRAGAEVAELYVENPQSGIFREKKSLRGFTKVFLQPGGQKECRIMLNERSFSIYDTEDKSFVMPSGSYRVLISASLTDERLSSQIIVKGRNMQRNDRDRFPSYFDGTVRTVSQEEFSRLYGRPLSNFDAEVPGNFSVKDTLPKLSRHSLLGKIVMNYAVREVFKMFPGKPHDDPEVRMMLGGLTEGTADCVSLQSGGALPYNIIRAIVSSANGHHFRAVSELIRKEKGSQHER